ncbi:MAG: hypothetical protein RL154_1238 [Pseudomonadota bacterium]
MKKTIITLSIATICAFAASPTVAVVDGKAITKEDVAKTLQMPEAQFDKIPAEEQKKAIKQIADRQAIVVMLKKEGIESTPEFKQTLENLKSDLAFDLWMKKQFDSVKVTDADAKAYYDKNKAKFVKPETYHAAHILVKTKEEADKIEADLAKAKDKKTAFAELAKQYSLDGSKTNGGDLGWFAKDQMVPEFGDALSKLKPGTYTTTPVKTQFGYHIIFLFDKKASEPVSFEQAKNNIIQGMKMEKLQEIVKAKVATAEKGVKIEIK